MNYAIGIDLGGTKISGVLVDEKGKILKKYNRATEAEKKRKDIINNILEVINNLKVKGVKGVGIGIPGFADQKGRITFMPNIKRLENINLKGELEKITGLAVKLDNDANCFALAEQRLGAAKGCRNVVGVIIGTGVGSGIIINGEIYGGAIGGAGEIGHTKLIIGDEIRSIENLISGTELLRRYNSLSSKDLQSLKEVDRKDPYFRSIYNDFVLHTGIFFTNIINTFNPECIVVGGGVSNLDFYKEARKVVDKHAVPALAKCCRIVKNRLGDDSGVIGAALLVMG